MKKVLINPKLLYVAGVIGLASTVAPHSLSAQGVSDIVRTLNAVINPGDAQRLEDQARRNNQPAEERYWRDYRAGLETHDRSRDTYSRRDYGDRRFDPADPRSFRSDAAINLELGQLSRADQRRYREMTDRERRQYDDRLAQAAQRRYERMTDRERQRYVDALEGKQQQRLDTTRSR